MSSQAFAATQAPEFLPPPEPGIVRSVGIAVLAHVVLALALSWGIRWNQSDTRIAAEAELWAPTVQQAAPKPVEPPPQPAPPPAPEPRPQPRPEPAPPPPPPQKQADIAVEREKQRRAQEQARQAEERRQAELRKRQEAERQAEAQRKREEQARAAADAKRRQEQQQRQEEQRLAQMREENLRRIQGMAGATGGPTAQGNAQRSAGPSDSYAGRIRARVRPNIVFTDDVPGNPSAEVRVRLAPDGTIVGKQLLKSSGVKSWDDAVLRALDRTEVLPRDVDGRVPGTLDLVFRPRD